MPALRRITVSTLRSMLPRCTGICGAFATSAASDAWLTRAHRAVADLLGVSLPTVKTHLSRAVRALRARLCKGRDDE